MSSAWIRQAASLGQQGEVEAEFQVIWDTGASATCISPAVSKRLGLRPISMATVHAAGNSYDSQVFKVDVKLPNNLRVIDVRVLEAVNIHGADVLIGMDIITTGDFTVTNADNDTWFSFRFPPALDHIDYAAEANKIVQRREHREQARRMQRKGKLR